MKKFLILLLLVPSLNSCFLFSDDVIQPEDKKILDAYATVSNYHTIKQMAIIQYYALFTNDFNNEMYELIPNGNQQREFWDTMEILYEIERELETALSTIENMEEVSTANNLLLLKSIKSAKWDWLWKKVYWVGDRIEMREKLTTFFNNASQKEKEEAFQTFADNGRVNGISDVTEFVSKLDKGELDTRAFNFDKDLEVYHSTYSNWKEENGVARNIESAFKIGKKGTEHATKIMTKSVEFAIPPVGTAFNVLDKVNKFCEYTNNFLSDDAAIKKVENNIQKNYKSFTTNSSEHSKSIVEQAKVVSKTYTINKEPASTVVNYSNIDWGGLSVSIEDKAAEISTIIAERSSELYDDIWPAILIYTDLVKNELGEWDVALPEGDWDVTIMDEKGNIKEEKKWPIMPAHFSEIPFTGDAIPDTTKVNTETGIVDDEVLALIAELKTCKVIEIYVDPNDGEDAFKLKNDLFLSQKTEITWSHNTFESVANHRDEATSLENVTFLSDSRDHVINGKIYKKDESIMLDITYDYKSEHYNAKGSPPYNIFIALLGIQKFSAIEVLHNSGKLFTQVANQRKNAADFANFYYEWTYFDSDSTVTSSSIRNEFKTSNWAHYNVTFRE